MLRAHGFLRGAAAAAALLPISAAAQAERWQAIGTDGDSTTAFIDTDSVVASGAVRTFTMKYTIPAIPNVRYTLITHRVDCAGRTVDDLHMTAFGADGQVVLEQDDTNPPRPVLAGSKGETVLGKVCQ